MCSPFGVNAYERVRERGERGGGDWTISDWKCWTYLISKLDLNAQKIEKLRRRTCSPARHSLHSSYCSPLAIYLLTHTPRSPKRSFCLSFRVNYSNDSNLYALNGIISILYISIVWTLYAHLFDNRHTTKEFWRQEWWMEDGEQDCPDRV